MFILEKTTPADLALLLQKEVAVEEKRRETVQRWGESISMHTALAPVSGYKIVTL